MTALWICSGVIAILAIWAVTIYNRLVKLRNNRENAFADIDVQLKQRHDLVPQLVATARLSQRTPCLQPCPDCG